MSLLDVEQLWRPGSSIQILVALLALYLLYYITNVVNKPRLFGGEAKLKPHLLACCPTLSQYYWPTIWAFNCHCTTLLRFILQRDIDIIQYHRIVLTLPDGGEVGLDWGTRGDGGDDGLPSDAPILIIMAGLTGSSNSVYVKYLADNGLCCGYRPVVFNQRGTGGLLLKTPRMYCATKIDDLQHVLNYLQDSFPQSDIVAVGISLGGMVLTQYLYQTRHHSDLKAAMVISCPWNPAMTADSLERGFFNRRLYVRHLVKRLKELVIRNASVMAGNESFSHLPINLDHILESTTISEIDERLTCPVFGYRCLDDYYTAASNWDKVPLIATPFICLSAIDDPFVPAHSLPLSQFCSNPHTVLVTTTRGGHFGFIEGVWPNSQSWMNRVCREFLVAMTIYEHQ